MTSCRFAPSPNGPLHLGHAYSALCNERVAIRCGAQLLLRLEDIDMARCTPALEAAVLEDLAWLGYAWTGPVLRQSERFARYGAALGRLDAAGLLYPCFCTRGAILAAVGEGTSLRDPDGSPLYPGICRALTPAERARRIAAGEPYALRLHMDRALDGLSAPLFWTEYREGREETPMAADPARWGDAILRRKDIPASYHIAVVVDDAEQGISDIVRGEDLLASTDVHRLLQVLLDLPEPRYHHHRLVHDEAGQKLSKSRDAPALAALRQQGFGAADVRRCLSEAMAGPQGSSIASQ